MDEICPHCLARTVKITGIGSWCPTHGDDLEGHMHTMVDGKVYCHAEVKCVGLPTNKAGYFRKLK